MSANTTQAAGHTPHAALINWKTHAWTDPGMVSWYSQRMVENSGTNQLKHLLEIDLIRRNASGKQVVDVGTGTGRAAIALARDGYQVTGVDSSQAMLDETRRLAEELPLDLRQGDLLALPCTDGSADTVVALNVLVHFPNWREALMDWLRVVRPGGRILFDIHSLANAHYAFGQDRASWPEPLTRSSDPNDFMHFNMRVTAEEIVELATDQQLCVRGIHPYGAFLSAGNVNWKLWRSLELNRRWQRLQSWIAKDSALFQLNLFIEQALIEHLAPSMAGRLFVVLEKRNDPAANEAFLEDFNEIERGLQGQADTSLVAKLPLSIADYHAAWTALLPTLRCQHYLFQVFKSFAEHWPGLDWFSLLPTNIRALFTKWQSALDMDQQALSIARHWADGLSVPSGLQREIAAGAQYNLVEQLLRQHYGCFSGVRT